MMSLDLEDYSIPKSSTCMTSRNIEVNIYISVQTLVCGHELLFLGDIPCLDCICHLPCSGTKAKKPG